MYIYDGNGLFGENKKRVFYCIINGKTIYYKKVILEKNDIQRSTK